MKNESKPLYPGHPYSSPREFDTHNKVYRMGIHWYAVDDFDRVAFTNKEIAILHSREVQKRRGDARSRDTRTGD